MNQPSNTPTDGKVNLAAAPGADINFDDLFPVEPENLGALQAAPAGTNPPQTPQAPEYVIKSDDGKIVYKTADEAINGIRHKDELVERYRTYLQSQGVDPNTLQKQPEPQAQPSNGPQHKYIGQEDKLFDALSSAVASRDKKAYASALREYNEEVMNQNFAPVAPYIAEVARQKAVREVSKEAPEFVAFQNSAAWQETLNNLPKLKQAIEYSEQDFTAASSLSELYKIAYLVSKGMRPEPVVTQPVPQAQPTPAPVARPTLGVSTMTPPQPSAPPSMATREGRQALIADLQSRNIMDQKF